MNLLCPVIFGTCLELCHLQIIYVFNAESETLKFKNSFFGISEQVHPYGVNGWA